MLTTLRSARAVLLACCLPAALFAEKPFAFTDTPGQLPKTVVPRHYTLRIQPDLTARTTTGTATIELEVLQPVSELVLNANELAIDSAGLLDDPAAPRALTPRLDPAKQTLTFPVALAAGPHTLTISYRGKIGTQAEGFFVDKYPTPTGDKLMLDALRASGGGAIAVTDEELTAEADAGSRLEGIDFAPEGGAAIAAAKALRSRGVLRADEEVVLFNTGAGWLYRQP